MNVLIYLNKISIKIKEIKNFSKINGNQWVFLVVNLLNEYFFLNKFFFNEPPPMTKPKKCFGLDGRQQSAPILVEEMVFCGRSFQQPPLQLQQCALHGPFPQQGVACCPCSHPSEVFMESENYI